MNKSKIVRLLQEKSGGLDDEARRLVWEVLERLPEDVDIASIREISSIYLGTAYGFAKNEWVIFLDWNILHRPLEAGDKKTRILEGDRAKGVIALNLAHYALKHNPKRIHLQKSYEEAKELAVKWGFEQEIAGMESEYL